MRKPLQEVLPRNDGLARYIAAAVGETRSNDLSAEEWLRSLENQIDLTLLADYNWSRKVPVVEGYLASVLRRRSVLASQERSWQEDVTSLLIETHNLAESVLQWLLKQFSVDVRRLPDRSQDNKWTKEIAVQTLQALPIAKLDDELVRRLASQNLREIRNALIRGNSSLKALMFAALLSTIEHSDHPFLKLSADELRLTRLLDMADARNKKAGHSGSERIDREEAMEHADFVIEWVQIFKGWY